MKNVTITLDEEVARWARIRAASRDTSLSRLVGELLRDMMRDEEDYQASMQHYLSQPARRLKKRSERYPGRAAIHDREALR